MDANHRVSTQLRVNITALLVNKRVIKTEYDQEIPLSHTADPSMAPGGRITEHLQ